MSDDERIARLTELARRVWPDVEVERGYGDDAWLVSNESGVALSIDHPRALDALKAALLVLSGTRFMVMIPPTRGYIEWQNDAQDEPPAWVEQLCKQWEREAMEPPPETVRTAHPPYLLRIALQECAKELRERAAKESR